MNSDTTLPLGEKIMLVRKAKGLSLDNAVRATNISKSNLSRLERGALKYSPQQINLVKAFLEIENAPLLEPELRVYRGRIWVWNDLITADRIAEAKDMGQELAIILALPFEIELCLLYTLTHTRLLIKESNIPAAEANLDAAEASIEDAGIGARFLYHRCKGSVCCIHGDYNSGLMHLLKALELGSDDIRPDTSLFTQIGLTYLNLGKPYSAIKYLEQAASEYQGDRTNTALMYLMNTLAICYEQVGEYNKAKKLLEETIIQAKYLKDNHLLGTALANMGNLCQRLNAYRESIAFCDQALKCFKEDKPSYAMALYIKASALMKARNLSRCKEVLQQGAAMCEGNQELTMMFEAQRHLLTLNNPGSIEYLEHVIIPYFKRGTGVQKFIALDICKELETHCKKRRLKTKAYVLASIIREIYEDVFIGEVDY